MWKDFLYFTKTERRGIIILVILIIGVFSFPLLIPFLHSSPKPSLKEREKFEREYNEFITSLHKIEQEQPNTKNHFRSSDSKEIHLAAFDPNTADSITFLSLGLPHWMAKNILNYRRKDGQFRKPEDFKKVYGLTEQQYRTLLPYIHIGQPFEVPKKDTLRILTASSIKRDSLIKYPAGTILSINEADTTELKKIPGIGSSIARMIVNYRKQLGGFCRIEQLQDIHLKWELLQPWFSINTALLRPIHVNKASIEQLIHHPYINFYQAKAIVDYRKKKGKVKDLKQFALYEEFTPSDLERIAPYLTYD